MGIILTNTAMGLSKQIRDDGIEAERILKMLASHYANTKLRIDAALAHPDSDATDRVKIAAALQEYLAKTDELRAVVEADIANLLAPQS